ncbi:MAG: hypothetical protein Q8R82_19765 [Hyphomonadaceae bacterium]|nr:hypothetical protein [Hyphomonadaceae bacterium]
MNQDADSRREADPVIRVLNRLNQGGVFFDIGANVGEVSEAMIGKCSKIVAVEADPGRSKSSRHASALTRSV